MDGSLVELETTELEAFKDYVNKMETEELEEGQEYPIKKYESDHFTLDISALNKVSFAVADDPFYKL
jgi:hypothetical protein